MPSGNKQTEPQLILYVFTLLKHNLNILKIVFRFFFGGGLSLHIVLYLDDGGTTLCK